MTVAYLSGTHYCEGGMMSGIPIKILLVEDDNDCANLTTQILEKAGISNPLIVVKTGKEALAVIHDLRPQVVLLDWGLPDISGADVLKAIKRESGDIIVIVLSVHLPERMGADCDSKPDYYISKPIDPIQFMMVLKSVGQFGFNIVDVRNPLHEPVPN